MTEGPILRATEWRTNGDMIADMHKLGYIGDMTTLDATYGKGNWWTVWAPRLLKTNDISPDIETDFSFDFRFPPQGMWWPQICYDPPYVSLGATSNKRVKDFSSSYGLKAPAKQKHPAQDVQQVINDGLTALTGCLGKGGTILVKCQVYTTGGAVWPGVYHTMCHAATLPLKFVDRFVHVRTPGVQPKGLVQRHARANCSELLIYRKTSD